MKTFVSRTLDVLLFIVPILDLVVVPVLISPEAQSLINPAYMAYYMLAMVILRRLVRVFQDWKEGKNAAV